MTPLQVAVVCHEANRAYCDSLGEYQHRWGDAPQWMRDSVLHGVKFHLANPMADDAASHQEWLRVKEQAGWKFGPVKDADKKEHPCMMPFSELPPAQQAKDWGVTASGAPKHPLARGKHRIPSDQKPILWRAANV